MATSRRQQIQLSPEEQAAFFRERRKAALATIDLRTASPTSWP
jgi:hypothetical protein